MEGSGVSFEGKVVSFIDIGTNSIRTAVVRLNPNYSYTVLSRQKQVVRLGEAEFLDQMLIPEAMDRCVVVCRRFMEMGKAFGSTEFMAVATSAAREAKNQEVLLERLRKEAGLEVRVVSGKEEARLIYVGVASSMHLEGKLAVFMDIGGGSTEVAVGDSREYLLLDSLKLGAIRISTLFNQDDDAGPVYPERYALMKKSVRNESVRTIQRVRAYHPQVAVGSSGTIMNLAEIANRSLNGAPPAREQVLTLARLKKVIAHLCSLDLEERRKVPGINPERADIIVGGAAVLETLMEEIGLAEIVVSDRGLLDGMLFEYLSRLEGFPYYQQMSVRERSVLQLGRSCAVDEGHANTIKRLALEMFDSGKEEGLHDLGPRERELLEYAAYLHDVGDFISFTNHQAHSYYIIRNAELLGFDQKEIEIMANLAKYHRKKGPSKKEGVPGLDEKGLKTLIVLSAFLRIAESLDRSHCALIKSARFVNATDEGALLEITMTGDCQLETWGVESQVKGFRKAFDLDLLLRFRMASALDGEG